MCLTMEQTKGAHMKREFIYLQSFDKNWIKLGLNDDDLIKLENLIMLAPNIGELIQGTGGLRKLRFALPNTGKSGGVRVLFIDYISHEKTFFLNVYVKNEKESINDKEKAILKQKINIILKHLRKGV